MGKYDKALNNYFNNRNDRGNLDLGKLFDDMDEIDHDENMHQWYVKNMGQEYADKRLAELSKRR